MTQLPKRRWDVEYTDLYQTSNGIWYLRYWSPKLKREIEPSLKTTIKARALKARKKILENIGDEKSREAVGYKDFRSVGLAFKRDISWEAKATELVALNQIDHHLLPWFGNYPPDRVDNNLWRKYAIACREKNPSCSLHNARKYLWKIVNWAVQKGIMKKKFVPDDFDKDRKSPGRIVTREELDTIQWHLPQDWRDLSEMAFQMAFRISELKQLEWSRVNFETGEITLYPENTKTRKGRKPVMPSGVREILMRRFALKNSAYVFPGKVPSKPFSKSDTAWQRGKRLAKITCRFHDLRHSWLTDAFKTSNRYAEICQYAGLSLEEALETYVKFTVVDMTLIASFGESRGRAGPK